MLSRVLIPAMLILLTYSTVSAQDATVSTPAESSVSTRYSLAVIDDATFYSGMPSHAPQILNQVLLEPAFGLRYKDRLTFSTSLIGLSETYDHTASTFHVKETYTSLSAGNFDFTAGRKMLRWGTGYAFTAAGVLDPPRMPTNPSDRLNTNQGRDMIKADWVRGSHALTLAWSTAALAPADSKLRDTAAFRYNVLVRGFDTSLIAGNDRGSDTFGALTFTRVVGQAWEVHGEAVWREQAAALIGAKLLSEGPCDMQVQTVGGFGAEQVPVGAECEDGLDRMATVRQLASDVQRQVELGGCDLPSRAQGAALAGFSPEASLAFTRPATSSSAVTSAAFQAKRAS